MSLIKVGSSYSVCTVALALTDVTPARIKDRLSRSAVFRCDLIQSWVDRDILICVVGWVLFDHQKSVFLELLETGVSRAFPTINIVKLYLPLIEMAKALEILGEHG